MGDKPVQKGQISLQEIPLNLLVPHPENSNFMDEETLKKLRRHIERTGRYEPLTVRPHPLEKGRFQVVNGHNRLRVLRALNYEMAHCVVWNLDDNETRIYLATLNRLSGKEVPERRAMLLEHLFTSFDIEEITSLLPDNQKQLDKLKELSHIDLEDVVSPSSRPKEFEAPVILSFMMEESEAKEVNLALDLLINQKVELTRSQALIQLAKCYLSRPN